MSQQNVKKQSWNIEVQSQQHEIEKVRKGQQHAFGHNNQEIMIKKRDEKHISLSKRKYPLRKQDKESEDWEEAQKNKGKNYHSRAENPLECYVKMVEYLKKIEWDQANLQNKMNPINALTSNCFWFMISAEYFSYNFWNAKSPKDIALEYMHKVNKIPVGIPTRLLKPLPTQQSIKFQSGQLRETAKIITEKLNNLIPHPLSPFKSQSYQKGNNLTTYSQDDIFRSSTRALVFNYVRRKMKASEKWESSLSPRLKLVRDIPPRKVERMYGVVKIQESSSKQADPQAVQCRHRKKQKKIGKKNKQAQLFIENEDKKQPPKFSQEHFQEDQKNKQLQQFDNSQIQLINNQQIQVQRCQNKEESKPHKNQFTNPQNLINKQGQQNQDREPIQIQKQQKPQVELKNQNQNSYQNKENEDQLFLKKQNFDLSQQILNQVLIEQVFYGQQQLLLDGIMHLPLDKIISVLQSLLPKNQIPQITELFLKHPTNDPLQLIYQLHPQEEEYLDYLKQSRIKLLKQKQHQKQIQKQKQKLQNQNQKSKLEIEQNNQLQEKQLQNQKKDHLQSNLAKEQPQEIQNIQFQDAKCQICTDGDYTDDNLIVFCSKCNISLHQRCVGLTKVPAQSWICEVCQAFGPAGINVPCPLCNVKGGALKRTNIHIDTLIFKDNNPYYYQYAKNCNFSKQKEQFCTMENEDDKEEQFYYDYFIKSTHDKTLVPSCHYVWVHYVCAIWVPQCYFEEKNGLISIKGVENIDKKRFKMECQICKKSKIGACVKCQEADCEKYYHPECARKKKIYMEQLNLEKLKYLIFCSEHEPLKLMRQIEYKKKKARDEIIKFCRMIQKYVETYKIAYLPFKLHKNILNFNNIKNEQIKQNQPNNQPTNIEKKNINPIGNQKLDDQVFVKSIIDQLQKNRSLIIHIEKVNKPNQTGYKVKQIEQPSKRAMRKSLYRYDQFWTKLTNGENGEQNYFRYLNLIKQNTKYRNSIEKITNGCLFNSTSNIVYKKENKGGRKKKKLLYQTQIQQQGGIFCICRKPYQGETDMIECQICAQWYHFRCIGFIGGEDEASQMQFHCMKCMKFQDENQKTKRMEKYRQFFSQNSLFFSFRPDTPSLQSQQQPQIDDVQYSMKAQESEKLHEKDKVMVKPLRQGAQQWNKKQPLLKYFLKMDIEKQNQKKEIKQNNLKPQQIVIEQNLDTIQYKKENIIQNMENQKKEGKQIKDVKEMKDIKQLMEQSQKLFDKY